MVKNIVDFCNPKFKVLKLYAFFFVQRKSSVIRALQWHPHIDKYAVAFKNDVVKVFSKNHPPVILKHPKQIDVTCIAWKYD